MVPRAAAAVTSRVREIKNYEYVIVAVRVVVVAEIDEEDCVLAAEESRWRKKYNKVKARTCGIVVYSSPRYKCAT